MATKTVSEITINKIRIGGKAPTKIMKGSTEVKKVTKGSTVVYQKENITYTLNNTSSTTGVSNGSTSITFTVSSYKGSSTAVAISTSNISVLAGSGTVTSVTSSGTTYTITVRISTIGSGIEKTHTIKVTQPGSGLTVSCTRTQGSAATTKTWDIAYSTLAISGLPSFTETFISYYWLKAYNLIGNFPGHYIDPNTGMIRFDNSYSGAMVNDYGLTFYSGSEVTVEGITKSVTDSWAGTDWLGKDITIEMTCTPYMDNGQTFVLPVSSTEFCHGGEELMWRCQSQVNELDKTYSSLDSTKNVLSIHINFSWYS